MAEQSAPEAEQHNDKKTSISNDALPKKVKTAIKSSVQAFRHIMKSALSYTRKLVAILLLGGLGAGFFLSPFYNHILSSLLDKPEITIGEPKISRPITRAGGDYLEFVVSVKGKGTTDFVRFSYERLSQTENTCKEGLYFFNSTSGICNFTVLEESSKGCDIEVPPLSSATPTAKTIRYTFWGSEKNDFYDKMGSFANCTITEMVRICGYDRSNPNIIGCITRDIVLDFIGS